MKKIRITIGLLEQFRKYVGNPREMKVPDTATVLDLIALLDQEYVQKTQNDNNDHRADFMDEDLQTLMQLLWDPTTQRFYDDVGIEARTAPPASDALPIETEWNLIIPDGSWLVLTPNAGC